MMKQHIIDALERLGIKPTKWGYSFRLKIRNEHGRLVYISKPDRPSKVALVSKFYKINQNKLNEHFKKDFISNVKIDSWYGELSE